MSFLGGIANSLVPNYNNSYNSLNQAIGYQQPFYNAGTNALGPYMSQLSGLTNTPTGLEDSIMSQYSTSPQAQYQLNQGTAATNAAACDVLLSHNQLRPEHLTVELFKTR